MASNITIPFTVFQARKIDLLPVLLAQQLVLLPLYFYLPIWVLGLNIITSAIVYFGGVKNGWMMPKWLKVGFTVVVTAGVLITFHRIAGRDAGVALISAMYGLKILEIQSKRDVYILMLLGFFVLLAGFLFDQSPIIAAYQLIPIAAIFNSLTSINSLQSESNLVARSFARTSGTLFRYLIFAIPLMLILFVFFPRLSGPIWKMPGGSRATSGISDTMSPGAVSNLQLFEEVAFRVKFTNETPNESRMYWRTLVLDKFDGFTWSRNSENSRRVDLAKTELPEESENIAYEISLEKTQQKWLTMLDRPSNIPKVSTLYSDFSVAVPYRINSRIRYVGESRLSLTLDPQLSIKQKEIFTQLPNSGNPRSRAWAVNHKAEFNNNKDYIRSILSTINQQPYFYTLSPPIMERDTVDSFWLNEKQGFCEHYSAALVFLARAAGVPARVVVGYQGAEKNPLSDYWIVRYANAHAWTEVWFEGEGWVRIDPTSAIAPERVEEQLRSDYYQRDSLFEEFGFDAVDLENIGWAKNIGFWLDQANTGWNDWVLDYGRDKQKDLFSGLGLSRLNSGQILLVMMLLVGVFLIWISFSFLRARDDIDATERAFRVLVQKLSKAGINCDANTCITQLEHRLMIDENESRCYQSNSLEQIIELLRSYSKIRYQPQANLKIAQKNFQNRVKSLKIQRL